MNAKAPGNDKKNRIRDARRGTQNEVEILALIIKQDEPMRLAILERLRQAKARHLARQDSRRRQGGLDEAG